jgi:hypothetical protein
MPIREMPAIMAPRVNQGPAGALETIALLRPGRLLARKDVTLQESSVQGER